MGTRAIRSILYATSLGVLLAGGAFAQTTPSADGQASAPETPAAATDTAAPGPATETTAPDANSPAPAKPAKKKCPTTGSRLGSTCQAGHQADPREVLENRTNPSGMPPR
ncbi:hypothetical protein [Nitrospirillum iridis]|uniref:Putative membrane protein n=1 Tax=Nitrospirillum iridis TaxID=765888 RepID=A0A7X0EAL4_9PROT|nr:hypothetical protein [Nitrospirillum iridis]MBB6249687.1 putative membrane protein [Nitrospirillum iridis]